MSNDDKTEYTIIAASDTWALVRTPGKYTTDKRDHFRVQQVIGWAFEDGHPDCGDPIVIDGEGCTTHLTPGSPSKVAVTVGPRSWCEAYECVERYDRDHGARQASEPED